MEDNRLTNAALLLFAKKPQSFFITSEIKCAQFYGNEITKPIPAYQIYRGVQQYEKAVMEEAKRLEKARLKELEAEKLQKEAEELKQR
ncbi:MAG: hypothetical protein LUE98_08720 [Tannerellaceae bacterium]|nr:hypothetical protein [Tannerellaceae bacterium]